MSQHLENPHKGGEVKLRKGDRFRLVKGEGMIGQKHVCTGTAIERVNGHDGNGCDPYLDGWPDAAQNSTGCYTDALTAIRAKREGR